MGYRGNIELWASTLANFHKILNVTYIQIHSPPWNGSSNIRVDLKTFEYQRDIISAYPYESLRLC